jgi:DNA-binding NarL/FixJ family response regulator
MVLKKQRTKNIKHKDKVLIVDGHPIVRKGLATIIEEEDDITVCGEADDSYAALKAVGELKPSVVIVDISLKGSNGIELTKSIRTRYPKLPVIVLSIYDESLYLERALRAGAKAYLAKGISPEKIVTAIRTVLNGELYVSDELSKKLLHKIIGSKLNTVDEPTDILSDREFEVFRLIGEGCKTSQMAKQLHLSVKTVQTYRERITRKLGLTDASELLQYAIKWSRSREIR